MTQDPGLRKGFVWGQIYIVLMIVFGLVGIIWGIMTFVGGDQVDWMMPMEMTTTAIIMVIISCLMLLSGIGLYGRWKWGLYFTYFLLCLSILDAIWRLIAFFALFGGADLGSAMITGRIIVFCLHVLISCLWLGYFIKRRSWFH